MATFGTFVDDVSLKANELNDCFRKTLFTPVIRQGSVVTTVRGQGFFFQVNKLVVCVIRANPGAVGDSNQVIEVDLPIAAASNLVRVIGGGYVYNFSTNDVTLLRIVQYSTTRVAFLTETTNSLTAYLGEPNGPNLQSSTNTEFFFHCMYEAA